MQEALCDEFVRASGGDTRTQTVYLYRELYLSGDPALVNHEYAYASRLKLLAAIDARQLDLVLMNREAYNLLSEGGYLLELSSRLDSEGLRGFLTENRVILQDNSLDIALGEAETYQATAVQEANALEVTQFPLFRDAGFTDSVFLGVLPDSPRMSAALDYIAYLCA